MSESITPPPFRKDLKLYPGPKETDGSPTYNLYDPVKAKYFKFSWEESLIFKLSHPGMTYGEIAAEIKKYAPVDVSAEDVMYFYSQAAQLGLLNMPKSGDQVYQEHEKGKGSFIWFSNCALIVNTFFFSSEFLIFPSRENGAFSAQQSRKSESNLIKNIWAF